MDTLSPKLRPRMRFHPPDCMAIDLLRAKITGNDDLVDFIPEAQSCEWEPWDLKNSRCIKTAYPEWWFFSRLDLKNRSGNRPNRATNAGYWKVTGKDKKIMSELGMIGKKKFLVFYGGRGKGERTNWAIHEYHIAHPGQNALVLCRLSYKHEKKSIKDPNFNDTGPAVSSPAASKSCLEEYESELLLASVFPESEVQATTTPGNFDGTIYVTTTPVVCNDKHFSAHAAENQLGELTTTNVRKELSFCLKQLKLIDENQGGSNLKDHLYVLDGPIIKSRANKINEAIQGLVQSTWDEANKNPTLNMSFKEEELVLIHLIQDMEKCNIN